MERLAAAIQAAVSDPAMRVRAAALGRRIQAEDGVSRAVQVIQSHPALAQRAPEATTVAPNQEGPSTLPGR